MRRSQAPSVPPEERVKSLVEEGSNVLVNHDVKATSYIRSGRELLRSANNYNEDGNGESALVLYTRFLTIFLEGLRTHPGYKDIPPPEKKMMKTYCVEVLPKAEALRGQLLEKFTEEFKLYKIQAQEALKAAHIELNAELKKLPKPTAPVDEGQGENVINWKWDPKYNYPFAGQFKPNIPELPEPNSLSLASPSTLPNVSYSDIWKNDVEGGADNTPKPEFDRNQKPNRFLSPMAPGHLREVIIPGDLIPVFLRYVSANTERNIETCGFLTGRIISGSLVITDLIIPQQDGTPDSCTAKGEEEYFNVQDKFDLITFGWIHTHPSQTAFLSSVDMHCQYGYQQMMPEAIAIVCSPRKDQVGTFTLNPVEGMEIIGGCKDVGFHTHPQTSAPLFIDATHHRFDKDRKVNVHDLRRAK